MFDVAKRQEPRAEKREERKGLYQENDFCLEGGSVARARRERGGEKRLMILVHE
jgi:hypothetical protein